jgi:hypothetical protein
MNMRNGYFVVESFSGEKRFHKYVCIIQDVVGTDAVQVMALTYCNTVAGTKLCVSPTSLACGQKEKTHVIQRHYRHRN